MRTDSKGNRVYGDGEGRNRGETPEDFGARLGRETREAYRRGDLTSAEVECKGHERDVYLYPETIECPRCGRPKRDAR